MLDPKPTSAPPSVHIGPSSVPDIAAAAASLDVHTGCNVLDPDIDPPSPKNLGSPPASVDTSKLKFKVGRRSKEDQEDWEKLVEDCDLMYLKYVKKKKMPVEQVFTQYLALKR